MPYTIFRGKQIHYKTSGNGKHVVLLHGYTESIAIWKNFIRVLSREFTVTAIDLPGFGESDTISMTHTMDLMAAAVLAVLNDLKIRKCIMIGHSLGGFTTLHFAEKHSHRLTGIGLFHSHPFEDTPETKANRERYIDLIRTDKMKFLQEYIALLFWEKTIGKYRKQVKELMNSAGKIPPESLVASMQGMKLRKDKTKVLKDLKVPVLFIIGQHDSRFPVARTWDIIQLPKQSDVLLLRDVSHMGFMEAETETIKAIRSFAHRIYTR